DVAGPLRDHRAPVDAALAGRETAEVEPLLGAGVVDRGARLRLDDGHDVGVAAVDLDAEVLDRGRALVADPDLEPGRLAQDRPLRRCDLDRDRRRLGRAAARAE